MATLFREYRVEPAPREHESMKCARARTLTAIKDSGMILLRQMLRPERIGVRWVKKESMCDGGCIGCVCYERRFRSIPETFSMLGKCLFVLIQQGRNDGIAERFKYHYALFRRIIY